MRGCKKIFVQCFEYRYLECYSNCYIATRSVQLHSDRTRITKSQISPDILQQHLKEARYLLKRCENITQVRDIINETPMADTALYNTALHECFERLFKHFSFNDVDYLINKMTENNVVKDTVTYHEILKIFSRSGNFEKCMQHFNDMVDKDRVKPNVVTFNRLIKCCRYSNNINDAHEILRLMKNDFNISPDVHTLLELLYLYSELRVTDLFEDNLIKIEKELKCGKRPYRHKAFRDVIDAMQETNAAIECIEKVFEIMLTENIIPDENVLNKMLYIVIDRQDSFRIVSYFDMLVELMSSSQKTKPLLIAVRALEILIGKQNDFISAYYFIDNCIKYGVKISNKRVLSLYWQCIKCAYLHLSLYENEKDYVIKLVENARDLPAQLQHIQMINILNKHRVTPTSINELYSFVLMPLLKLNIAAIENKDNIVYEILSHWYDSYYITKDLWNNYIVNDDGSLTLIENMLAEDFAIDKGAVITVFDVSNWNPIELKTLLIFLILERFGHGFINKGIKTLNIKLTADMDVDCEMYDVLKNKLISCYGEDISLDLMDSTQNILEINLESWGKCVNVELTESDSDDENDIIDKDMYLE